MTPIETLPVVAWTKTSAPEEYFRARAIGNGGGPCLPQSAPNGYARVIGK
jgi:hypothetical protein